MQEMENHTRAIGVNLRECRRNGVRFGSAWFPKVVGKLVDFYCGYRMCLPDLFAVAGTGN